MDGSVTVPHVLSVKTIEYNSQLTVSKSRTSPPEVKFVILHSISWYDLYLIASGG